MTAKLSLHDRLLRWFESHPGFHASGDIQRMVMQVTNYTPSNVSRRLRELENEGKLEVRYEKGHAYYRYRAIEDPLVWFEGLGASATVGKPEGATA